MSGTQEGASLVVKTVLLIEDNDDDIFFIKRACAVAGIPHMLVVIEGGQAALDYLSGALESRKSALPDLILLDVKLPKVSGHEVLKWLRSQPGLKHLPVIMLTASNLNCDLTAAYGAGATSYFNKRSDPAELCALI